MSSQPNPGIFAGKCIRRLERVENIPDTAGVNSIEVNTLLDMLAMAVEGKQHSHHVTVT